MEGVDAVGVVADLQCGYVRMEFEGLRGLK